MEQQQGQPMGFMPMPMLIQGGWGGRAAEWHGNEVPARVSIAIRFLDSLTFKTMTRGMANDVGMQEIEGQKLLPVESEVQAAACNMLRDYFSGKLKPTKWEEESSTFAKVDERFDFRDCPACKNRPGPRQQCGYCEGAGRIATERVSE